MSTLSARFAQLSKSRQPPKVNLKVQQKTQDQRSKRDALTQKNRGLVAEKPRKQNQRVLIKNAKKVVSGSGKGRRQVGTKGKKGNGRGKGEKKEKVTPMDLDLDMDKYWFEAGKGPNPVVASLDREMDDYFKSKKEAST